MNALKLVREVDRQINNGELSYEEGVELLHPLFDVEPVRHGHWIEHTSWYWTQECECSECGNIEYGFNYPYETEKAVDHAGLYCRRCGAKMDEVEDSE